MAELTSVTIVVTPIDHAARGSRRQLRELRAQSRAVLEAQESGDMLAVLRAADAGEAAMLPYLATSDGSDLADALDNLSIDDFNNLITVIMGGSAADVPKANSDD